MTSAPPDLSGKVVLLSGAGRPLGRALAEAFGRAGASLALHDLQPVHLDETRQAAAALGAQCRTYISDTGKGMPARELVADVVADWGRLDVLVNCLHVCPSGGVFDLDEWDWTRTLELNLSGPFLLSQAAAGVMREQGSGVILNFLVSVPARPSPALDASQMGLAGLTRAAAEELRAYNIFSYAIDAGEVYEHPGGQNVSLVAVLQSLALFLCTPAAAVRTGEVFHLE